MRRDTTERKRREQRVRSLLYQSAKGTKPATIEDICEDVGIKPSTLYVYVKGLQMEAAGQHRSVEDFKKRNVTRLAVKHYHELRKGENTQ